MFKTPDLYRKFIAEKSNCH